MSKLFIVGRLLHCSKNCGDEYSRELTAKAANIIDRLTAENERLRVALGEIRRFSNELYATGVANAALSTSEVESLKADLSFADAQCAKVEGLFLGTHKENERLRAALQWQPIETAPRDGMPILAREKGAGPAVYMMCAMWSGSELEGWRVPGARGWANVRWFHPTHWMHLPPPPALKENSDEQF